MQLDGQFGHDFAVVGAVLAGAVVHVADGHRTVVVAGVHATNNHAVDQQAVEHVENVAVKK